MNEMKIVAFTKVKEKYCLRYIELTEEDKEKLKGSYKVWNITSTYNALMTHFLLQVAKKLEKLENRENRNVDSDEEDDFDCDQGDYPSIDSFR